MTKDINFSAKHAENSDFNCIWKEYERVIIESLIASFGLDFIVQDRYGGDVDTINNVRKIENDSEMGYKNPENEKAYQDKEIYNTRDYHSDPAFRDIKRKMRDEFNNTGKPVDDTYVPGNTLVFSSASGVPNEKRAELDHVIAAKKIAEDRGRVLSGLDGKELANSESNLRFTNSCLNRNMSCMSVEEYIKWCEENPDKVNFCGQKGEPLTEEVKERLRAEEKRAAKEYNSKIYKRYYTSYNFTRDTFRAASKVGIQMGVRQALGFIFAEIYFSACEEIRNIPNGCTLAESLNAIGTGIKKGFENVHKNYKTVFARAEEGFAAGALASFTTTLCNIFFTTSKTLVRYIRQIYANVVRAGEILIINPDNLLMGDRLHQAMIFLSLGASTVAGTYVGGLLASTPAGKVPVISNILVSFCSSMVSGLLSCTMLVFIDRSRFIHEIVSRLNVIPSEVSNFHSIAEEYENIAEELGKFDYELLEKEIGNFSKAAEIAGSDKSMEIKNERLTDICRQMDVLKPWMDDFDSFMSDTNNRLKFA